MKRSRRKFLKFIATGSASIATANFLSCDFFGEKRKRPNIIIFLSDDLGYGDLGCYGNPIIKTPNIDKFATEGVRFTDCHSGGTVCSPSRAALLTGRNPYRCGFYYILGGGAHLRREEITIAKLLQKNGYDTCFVGKWHLSRFYKENSGQPTPGDHGFDHWFATEVNAFGGPRNPKKFVRNGKRVGQVDGWYCDVIVREAVRWLKNRPDPDKPFFLLVCPHEPHTPLEPPDTYADAYDTPEVDRLEKTIRYGRVERPAKDLSKLKKYYYGTVTQLDHAFGNLIREIDAMGFRDRSFVFFTSDNGPENPVNFDESRGKWEDPIRDRCFGTPGPLRGMKRWVYEGGNRVPGIARWPGQIKPDSISHELIDGKDLLPTFCQMAGIAIPTDRKIDGVSILPVLKGRKIERKHPCCWMFPAYEDTYFRMPQMAMREGDYVLVGWFNKKPKEQLIMDWIKSARLEKFELYNLRNDVGQFDDLANEEPERVKQMAVDMKKLWQDIQTDGPYWDKWKQK